MTTIAISSDTDVVTTINTFTVEPSRQRQVLDLLIGIATRVAAAAPGFLSAAFHTSADGTRIVTYAQFTSRDAVRVLEATIGEAIGHQAFSALQETVTSDFHIYAVSAIVEGLDQSRYGLARDYATK